MRSQQPRSPRAARGRRAALAVAAAVVPISAVTVLAWPAEAGTTPVGGGTYTLAAGASGKCIDVSGASADNSAPLVQAACDASAAHLRWRAVARAGGQFNLANDNSGRCVDVPSASTTSGTQLQQYGCGDGTKTNQLWTFTASSAAAGKYLVRSVATGLCISDKDGSTAGNNPIVEETCSDIARMQWNFTYVSGATSGPTAGPTTGAKPTVAADGSGTYRTVQAAIDAVPAGNTSRRVITIKAGTYREIVTIPADKPFITLRGLGSGPSGTVIVNNHSSAGGYGTAGSATVFINGHDFAATNLTMANDADGSQAVAASLNADRAVYDTVRFLGNQDTLLVYHYRSYIVRSYVEGTVDFIFGGGTAVFDSSTIYEKRSTGGPVTAANTDAAQTYGLLFYRCTIDGAAKGVTGLGRPWGPKGQVLYRESTMTASLNTAQPWSDMSGNSWKNARFFEYRNTGPGAGTNNNRPQLSDAQAPNYTPQRYLSGSDGWNPL